MYMFQFRPGPPGPHHIGRKWPELAAPDHLGDLWMRLQLMWLPFEAVRSPVGVDLGHVWGPKGPKSTPDDPDRTPDNLKMAAT